MPDINPLTATYAYQVNPPTNPYNQSFPIVDQYGNVYLFTLDDLVAYAHNGVIPSIVFAVQIGAAAITLIILIMVTKQEKRRLPVFALNSLALILTVIFGSLQCTYFTSAWYNPYPVLTSDFSLISASNKATSIAASLMTFLLQVCVETSLILQVHVVCVTLDRIKRLAVMLVSIFVALVSMGFRLAQTIDNIEYNVIDKSFNHRSKWLVQARNVSLTISICFFSIIFCAKLGWSLYQRHQLGLTRFGPMQIIFIGGTQTLIIPAVFSILQSLIPTSSIVSMVLGVTAISLPLTSLWASAATDTPPKAARGPDAHRKFIMSSSTGASSTNTTNSSKKARFGVESPDLESGHSASASRTPIADAFWSEPGPATVEKDMELQQLGGQR